MRVVPVFSSLEASRGRRSQKASTEVTVTDGAHPVWSKYYSTLLLDSEVVEFDTFHQISW